jgi:hypothetical protein
MLQMTVDSTVIRAFTRPSMIPREESIAGRNAAELGGANRQLVQNRAR